MTLRGVATSRVKGQLEVEVHARLSTTAIAESGRVWGAIADDSNGDVAQGLSIRVFMSGKR